MSTLLPISESQVPHKHILELHQWLCIHCSRDDMALVIFQLGSESELEDILSVERSKSVLYVKIISYLQRHENLDKLLKILAVRENCHIARMLLQEYYSYKYEDQIIAKQYGHSTTSASIFAISNTSWLQNTSEIRSDRFGKNQFAPNISIRIRIGNIAKQIYRHFPTALLIVVSLVCFLSLIWPWIVNLFFILGLVWLITLHMALNRLFFRDLPKGWIAIISSTSGPILLDKESPVFFLPKKEEVQVIDCNPRVLEFLYSGFTIDKKVIFFTVKISWKPRLANLLQIHVSQINQEAVLRNLAKDYLTQIVQKWPIEFIEQDIDMIPSRLRYNAQQKWGSDCGVEVLNIEVEQHFFKSKEH